MTAPDVNAEVRARFEAWFERENPSVNWAASAGEGEAMRFRAFAWNGYRAAHADLSGEVRDSNGRGAKDYAIEQAGYMARAATGLIAAVNDLELARQQFDEGEGTEDATDEAEQSLGDAINALRSCIYEFEKRRDRALAKFTQEKP